MKKWIYVVFIYGIGATIIYDVLNGLEWFRATMGWLMSPNINLGMYANAIQFLLPFAILIINYFALRIRAKSTAFTLVNALFYPALFILLFTNIIGSRVDNFADLFENLVNVEVWTEMWTYFSLLIILSIVNLISGIVISEAKTKGAYLGAEFIYLMSGIVLALFIGYAIR